MKTGILENPKTVLTETLERSRKAEHQNFKEKLFGEIETYIRSLIDSGQSCNCDLVTDSVRKVTLEFLRGQTEDGLKTRWSFEVNSVNRFQYKIDVYVGRGVERNVYCKVLDFGD